MKPLTTGEIQQLERVMAGSEQDAKYDYGNRSGKFAHAKLIDFDDDKFIIELRSGIQDDCTNRVHHDIIIASRKHLGVTLGSFEEETLSTL
jgi:hypothetical protein